MELGLAEWLHAEAPARKVFARPPLMLALCQIRFATKFGLNDSGVAPFQEEIEDEYPNPDRQEEFAAIQVAGPAGQVGEAQLPRTLGLLWKFTDPTGDWTVTLTQDFITLETRAYANFDDFLERLQRVLQALVQTVKPGIGRRIGLRYINEIRSSEQDWAKIIRSEVLGILTIAPIQSNCDQAIQILSLRDGEARINLQHGAFPTGTTVVPKPGSPKNDLPFYLLDVDVYQEFSASQHPKVDPSVICKQVEEYHSVTSKLFRWATTDEYRASLGERCDVR